MEHMQSDNELESDFDEDEVENEEVDEEDKWQISASCCFCCTLTDLAWKKLQSLFYNLYRNVNFIYLWNFCESITLLLSSIIGRLIQTTEIVHALCWAKGLAPDSPLLCFCPLLFC